MRVGIVNMIKELRRDYKKALVGNTKLNPEIFYKSRLRNHLGKCCLFSVQVKFFTDRKRTRENIKWAHCSFPSKERGCIKSTMKY